MIMITIIIANWSPENKNEQRLVEQVSLLRLCEDRCNAHYLLCTWFVLKFERHHLRKHAVLYPSGP